MSFIKNILKSGADDIAEAGLKAASKQSDDVAEQLIKKKLDDVAEAAAKKAEKESAEAAAKKAATGAESNISKSFVKDADNVIEEAAKKKAVSKTKMAAVALAAGGIAYVVIDPLVESNKKNGSRYTISKIKIISDTVAQITYSPGVSLYIKDTLNFVRTDCQPPLTGTFEINKIIDSKNVEIKLTKKLTKDGKMGTMILRTNYENQVALQTEQFKDNVSKGFDSVLDTLGIDPKYFTYIKYTLIAIVFLIILGIFYKIYNTFFLKTSSFGSKKK